MKINLEIKNANHGQLQSLQGELRILSRQWKPFGPVITINGKAPGDETNLRIQAASKKRIGKKWARNLARW